MRRDDEGLAVVVTATARATRAARECMVASGRFTFSTFAVPSASICHNDIKISHMMPDPAREKARLSTRRGPRSAIRKAWGDGAKTGSR